MNNFKNGQIYYDDKNGRYLTIVRINENSKTVYCHVYEYNDTCDDVEYTDDVLFTFNEMRHFELKVII